MNINLCVSCALAAVVGHSAFGFSWDEADDGGIVINEAVSVTTDADAAKMAALTSIVFGESGSIACSSLTSAFTLKADLSGPGSFSATDCAGTITLTGDNHALTGGFAFTNTPAVVASRYGLGGASSRACSIHYGDSGSIDFNWNETFLTNDVQLVLDCKSGKGNQVIGPSDAAKTLVQRGGLSLKQGGGTYYLYFCGDIIFDGGRFENPAGQHLYSSAKNLPSGKTDAVICFTENTTLFIGSYWFALGHEIHHLNCTVEKLSYLASNTITKFVCEKNNVFPSGMTLSIYKSTSMTAGVDLNGHDQTIGFLNCQQSVDPNETKFCHVWSEQPATLTVTSTATDRKPTGYRLDGQLGYHHNGTYTAAFSHFVSTSTGDLTVSKGAVEFCSNAGWSGTNVVVEGGLLAIDSPRAFATTAQKLIVRDSGKLKVTEAASSTGAYFAEIWFGETELGYGKTYKMSELKAMAGVGDYIDDSSDDDAVLTVAMKHVDWEGWPEEGGEVVIPENAHVPISDADVERVEKVTRLHLSQNAVITCENAAVPLVLSAEVSGAGVFEIINSAGVILAGDSSQLVEPGHFTAVNSEVTVTHRYGLGGTGTGAFELTEGDVFFTGSGLTNDVGILYSFSGHHTFGPVGEKGPWVQRGDLISKAAGSMHYTYFRNDVVLAGNCRFGAESNSILYYSTQNDTPSSLTLTENARAYYPLDGARVYLFAYGTSAIKLAPTPGATKFNGWYLNVAPCPFVCGRKDVFADLADGLYLYYSKTPSGRLDLGGFDQQMPALLGNGEEMRARTNNEHAVVFSQSPATVRMVRQDVGSKVIGVKFTGAAGLACALGASDVYTIVTQKSTSTGALTVESGTLALDAGASWGGTNIVVSGGQLKVLAASANPFTAVDANGRAAADLFVAGGTLDLAAGVAASVCHLKVGDTYLKRDTYKGGDFPWLTGSGTLTVRKNDPNLGLVLIFR